MENKDQYTKIHFQENGKIRIEYTVFFKTKENGKFICYMPGFGFSFSASSKEIIIKKADAMAWAFFDYYHKKEGFDKLILAVHRLGFRSTQHNYVMDSLLKNKMKVAHMKLQNQAPEDFADAEAMQSKYEIAA